MAELIAIIIFLAILSAIVRLGVYLYKNFLVEILCGCGGIIALIVIICAIGAWGWRAVGVLVIIALVLCVVYYMSECDFNTESIGVGCGFIILLIIIVISCKSCSCDEEPRYYPPSPRIVEIQEIFQNQEKRIGIGRGSGDTIQEATTVATIAAISNAFESKIERTSILYLDDSLDDTLWQRNSAIVHSRTIKEYNEEIDGKNVLVEVEVSQLPQTHPLRESADLGKQNNWVEKQEIVNHIKQTSRHSVENLSAVKGYGSTYEEAIDNACQNALCMAYGGFVESAIKMKNGEFIRNQKMEFFNGFIRSLQEKRRFEDNQGLCVVELDLEVQPRGQEGFCLTNAVNNIKVKTLKAREEKNIENFLIELNNLKSVVPFLYDFEATNVSIVSLEQNFYRRLFNTKKCEARFNINVSINEHAYYYKFLPRMLIMLNNSTVKTPVFLENIGSYQTGKYSFYHLDRLYCYDDLVESIALVDRKSEVSDELYAICFNLSDYTMNMYNEWLRQEYLDYEIKIPISIYNKYTEKLLETKYVTISAEDILLKLEPSGEKYEEEIYKNIWAPFCGEANRVLTFEFEETFDVDEDITVEFFVDLQNIARPKMNMDLIKEAAEKTHKKE